jgi:vacuolar-type H+-ATPase subunit H
MQEVIDELLRAEADAQKIIAQAQDEARQIKADVENEYALKLNEAREEARRTVLAEVEKAKAAAKKEHDAVVGEARATADDLWRSNEKAIAGLTDEVIALVLEPEYEKE